MATVTVLQKAPGTNYSINVTLESNVIKTGGTGAIQYYIHLSTYQKDPEGRPIPDQFITSFSSTDPFTVPVDEAITVIMGHSSGALLSSSSSSHSSQSSASSLSSHH